MTYDPERHHRRSIRLKGYDYAHVGAYFVTICVRGRECLFGDIVSDAMQVNEAGRMIQDAWVALPERFPTIELDEFSVMPTHFHGIILITNCVGVGLVPAHVSAPDEASATGAIMGATTRATTRVAPTAAPSVGAGLVPARVPALDDASATETITGAAMGMTMRATTRVAPTAAPSVGAGLVPARVPALDDASATETITGAAMGMTMRATTRVAPTAAPIVGAGLVPAPALVPAPESAPTALLRPTLGHIVGAFKSITTHEYVLGVRHRGWLPFPGRLWQRDYYEHIIRSELELDAIRAYIATNPLRWALDAENPLTRRPGIPEATWQR